MRATLPLGFPIDRHVDLALRSENPCGGGRVSLLDHCSHTEYAAIPELMGERAGHANPHVAVGGVQHGERPTLPGQACPLRFPFIHRMMLLFTLPRTR